MVPEEWQVIYHISFINTHREGQPIHIITHTDPDMIIYHMSAVYTVPYTYGSDNQIARTLSLNLEQVHIDPSRILVQYIKREIQDILYYFKKSF